MGHAAVHELEVAYPQVDTCDLTSTAVAASASDSSSWAEQIGEGAADAATSSPTVSLAPSEATSTAVAVSASGSNSCQTVGDSETASTAVAASEAGTASPSAADALKSESDAVVTPAPSPPANASVASPDGHTPSASAADTLKDGSATVVTHAADALESGSDAVVTPAATPPATQQSVSPEPPACSVSSPADSSHESLKQGVAPHLAPSSCTTLHESDSVVSGGDAAAEQAPALSLDGSQAELLTPSPATAAPSQSACSRGDAEQPEDSPSCHSNHGCGNQEEEEEEEEEQRGEQNPTQPPAQEEEEHSAPLLLPLPLLLPAGSAQEGAQEAQAFAQDVPTDATTVDAPCSPAEVPEPKKKPGFLAKTVFCTIFSLVLVPVLAVGGCLQLYEALSVQRTMWKYTMAGSQKGCN